MGGGGTSQTTSQQSGPAKYVQPFAKDVTGQAQQLYTGSGYPQQQTAGFSPDQLAGMGMVEGMTPDQQALLGQAQYQNAALAGGTPQIGAALNSLTGMATGQNPALDAAMMANFGMMNDPSIQSAQQANQAFMSGQYADPASNPALQAYLNAGMQPMIQNYQQAIAPNILANAVTSGGLGSSGTEQAFSNAQNQLAQQLGNYSASVVEPAYQQAMQQQQAAIGMAPQLLQPEQQAIGQVPGLLSPQLQAAGQIPGMYAPQESAIGQAPGLSQAAYGPSGQLLDVGQQQQQQLQNVYNSLFQNQMMPYQMLTQAAGLISPLSGGGGQSFSVASQPGGGSMK
jgi:hypothetical protein